MVLSRVIHVAEGSFVRKNTDDDGAVLLDLVECAEPLGLSCGVCRSGFICRPTAVIKGLFYSDESLDAIERALGVSPEAASTRSAWPLSKEDVDEGIMQIQTHGHDGPVYGKALRDWEEMLFSLARVALPAEERHYLDALELLPKTSLGGRLKHRAFNRFRF